LDGGVWEARARRLIYDIWAGLLACVGVPSCRRAAARHANPSPAVWKGCDHAGGGGATGPAGRPQAASSPLAFSSTCEAEMLPYGATEDDNDGGGLLLGRLQSP
jgi:hypothetical protein